MESTSAIGARWADVCRGIPVTEDQWLCSQDPAAMLDHLGSTADARKLRLFACACCRRVWHMLPEGPIREAVEVCERVADGAAGESELVWAIKEARLVAKGKGFGAANLVVRAIVAGDLQRAAVAAAFDALGMVLRAGGLGAFDAGFNLVRAAEGAVFAGWIRCLFGNPFRPSLPLPAAVLAWSDGTLRRLAEGIYEGRRLPAGTLDTTRLAILADALLDAGCDDDELLAHCRSRGPHVRGCWVVDTVLGKTAQPDLMRCEMALRR
jgi:hypothetical protein